MAVSFGCRCPERRKSPADRNWVVMQRKCNHSAFSGYQYTPSDYSCVVCLSCGCVGRTKAGYVDLLRDWRDSDDKYLAGELPYNFDGTPR